MNHFDTLVDQLDTIQQDHFGVDVYIDGSMNSVRGVFDENTEEFEGVGSEYRTLEIPLSELSSTTIENGETVIRMGGDDRTFTVHRHGRVGKNVTLELR